MSFALMVWQCRPVYCWKRVLRPV